MGSYNLAGTSFAAWPVTFQSRLGLGLSPRIPSIICLYILRYHARCSPPEINASGVRIRNAPPK